MEVRKQAFWIQSSLEYVQGSIWEFRSSCEGWLWFQYQEELNIYLFLCFFQDRYEYDYKFQENDLIGVQEIKKLGK